MPERLLTTLLLLTTEIAEGCLGRLLVDAATFYLARRDYPELQAWLDRQSLD